MSATNNTNCLYPELKENLNCKCSCHDMKDYSKPQPYPTPLKHWFSRGCAGCHKRHQ